MTRPLAFDPAPWGGDPIPLAQSRPNTDPIRQAWQRLALASAQQIDQAVLAALSRRGLSLSDALPRLTRQVHGPRCTVLLDGQPLIEFGPPKIKRSAHGLVTTVTISSRPAEPESTQQR